MEKDIAQNARSAVAAFPIRRLHRGYVLLLPSHCPHCLAFPPPPLSTPPPSPSSCSSVPLSHFPLHLLIRINCRPPHTVSFPSPPLPCLVRLHRLTKDMIRIKNTSELKKEVNKINKRVKIKTYTIPNQRCLTFYSAAAASSAAASYPSVSSYYGKRIKRKGEFVL